MVLAAISALSEDVDQVKTLSEKLSKKSSPAVQQSMQEEVQSLQDRLGSAHSQLTFKVTELEAMEEKWVQFYAHLDGFVKWLEENEGKLKSLQEEPLSPEEQFNKAKVSYRGQGHCIYHISVIIGLRNHMLS